MKRIQAKIQEWWTLNPMLYDRKKTLKFPQGTREFFKEIDRRFFEAAFFAQKEEEIPFSRLVDYNACKGKFVLEIGCGAGALSALFAKQGALITAIDLTSTAVNYTKQRFQIFGLKGNILQMDGQAMGFKDACFDFIWSWGVIHHSEKPERIISEAYRVLKPGGKIGVMVYNRKSIYFWIYFILFRGIFCAKLLTHSIQEICNRYSDGSKRYSGGLIAKYYRPEEFIKILQKNNFSEIKMRLFGQKAEVYIMPRGIRAWFIKFIPEFFTRWLIYNFGRFLYLTAKK